MCAEPDADISGLLCFPPIAYSVYWFASPSGFAGWPPPRPLLTGRPPPASGAICGLLGAHWSDVLHRAIAGRYPSRPPHTLMFHPQRKGTDGVGNRGDRAWC